MIFYIIGIVCLLLFLTRGNKHKKSLRTKDSIINKVPTVTTINPPERNIGENKNASKGSNS